MKKHINKELAKAKNIRTNIMVEKTQGGWNYIYL